MMVGPIWMEVSGFCVDVVRGILKLCRCEAFFLGGRAIHPNLALGALTGHNVEVELKEGTTTPMVELEGENLWCSRTLNSP
jgi:hypothetical protein